MRLPPGQSTSCLFIPIDVVEIIYGCAVLMVQCIVKWRFLSVSICQEWLWKKCVIAVLTTRWHSALRQIPWGFSIPQRTPLPSVLLCQCTLFECDATKRLSFPTLYGCELASWLRGSAPNLCDARLLVFMCFCIKFIIKWNTYNSSEYYLCRESQN